MSDRRHIAIYETRDDEDGELIAIIPETGNDDYDERFRRARIFMLVLNASEQELDAWDAQLFGDVCDIPGCETGVLAHPELHDENGQIRCNIDNNDNLTMGEFYTINQTIDSSEGEHGNFPDVHCPHETCAYCDNCIEPDDVANVGYRTFHAGAKCAEKWLATQQ